MKQATNNGRGNFKTFKERGEWVELAAKGSSYATGLTPGNRASLNDASRSVVILSEAKDLCNSSRVPT